MRSRSRSTLDGIEVISVASGNLTDRQGWSSAEMWVVETQSARILLDPKRERATVYPKDLVLAQSAVRSSAPWSRAATDFAIPGQEWTWIERSATDAEDPWAEALAHSVDLVVAVRGIELSAR